MPSLLKLPGVGPIVAGVLLAETGDPRRFASPHHFLPVTVAQRQWKEAAGKTAACRSIPAGIVVSIGLFIIVAMVRLRIDGGRSKRLFDKNAHNFVGKRSALLSDFLKRTLLENYFESYNELRRALLSFLPTNKLMLDGILSVGRQVRPPHSGPRIGAPVASLRSRIFRASVLSVKQPFWRESDKSQRFGDGVPD